MKRLPTAVFVAATVAWAAACGGGGAETDETTGTDTVDAVATDAVHDVADDVRPDAAADTTIQDSVQDTEPQDIGDDAHAPDAAGDAGDVDDDDAGDTGEPSCEGAITVTADTPYEAAGLESTAASRWADYSCDAEWSYTGPERVFEYTAPCTGQVRLTVTPAGDPLSDSYLMVTVMILGACDTADCRDMLPPSHPIRMTAPTDAGETTLIVVESFDGALPDFTILAQQSCGECADDDDDGYDGFNALFCPDGDDCNDDDAAISPGAAETNCDGIDQDCSGADSCVSTVCIDNDEDGFNNYDPAACPAGRDCNDSNAAIRPGVGEIDCNGLDEDCDGIDWCPGTGQQCDSCLPTGNCREDHVCMPGIGGAFGMYAYCAALCENANQCPEGATCVPEVYEGHGVCMADTSASCDGNDLTVVDSCGNVAHSATCSGDCDSGAGVCTESCIGSSPASIGTTIAGRLVAGASGMTSYPGIFDVKGHEDAYSFTAECDGIAHVVATEMSDLEMVLLGLGDGCFNTQVVAYDAGTGMVHEIEFQVTGGNMYFVVVDTTIQDQEGPFTLLIEVDCGGTGRAHCAACSFDAQCESGHCHIPGDPPLSEGACVADCSADGDCPEGSACAVAGGGFVCMPDATAACDGQALMIVDDCGLEYVMETCADGTDCNAALKSCTDGCIDFDGDGYPAYAADTCPHGTDCRDDDVSIHPGADDARCNSIDEDCSGADNCSDNAQCEPCDGGHCAPGYYCFVDPNFDAPGICLDDCTADMECPTDAAWDLSCWSWMSGQGDDGYYCRPQVARTCSGGDEVVTDGCGRTVQTNECDFNCFDDFGCVNACTPALDHPGCGLSVHGTTVGAPDRTDYYYNGSDTVDDLTGPETGYRFTASCTGEIAAVLKNCPDWLTLVVLRNSSANCKSSSLVDYDVYLDAPEVVSFTAVEGEEFTLIVDGMDGARGEFDLTVNCLCGAGCVDNDADGFIDHDASDCPSGNDCDGAAAAIHPGAIDIACNDIDEDCSGYDHCLSHSCTTDVELGSMSETVVVLDGSTTGMSDEITFYGGACESPYPRFNVETVYRFTADCSGTFNASIGDLASDQVDMYLLEGACRADLCVSNRWTEMSVQVTAGHEYFLVIDGNAATANSWGLQASITCD